MFDLAWSEIAVIAIVALVVIGPKDLPKFMRLAGFWVRKLRSIAREFQGSVEQMVRDAELTETRQAVERATSTDIGHEIRKAVDPAGEIETALKPPEFVEHSEDKPGGATPQGPAT
jgi:sec-independent protein translocase protein TatB